MFDRSLIGHSFPPYTFTIERAKLRELALAIGDNNPIYQSEAAAHVAGYQQMPLPPTAGTIFLFWQNPHFIEHLAELGLDFTRLLHREEDTNILLPIIPVKP